MTIASPTALRDCPAQRLRNAGGGGRARTGGDASRRRSGRRFGRWRVVAAGEVELPPADVPPAAVLEADAPVDADGLEPDRLVQRDARLVRKRDTRARQAVAAAAKLRQERVVQRPADPAAGMVARHVDGGLDRPAIPGPVAV